MVINNVTQQISDIQKNKDSLIFNLSCASNEIEIVTLCNPFENTTLEGLYKSGDMISAPSVNQRALDVFVIILIDLT